MKIFVSEYIFFLETLDFNLHEEVWISNMFFDYFNYFDSLCKLDNRFMFKKTYYCYDLGNNIFVRKKQIANTFFWRRKALRREIFFKLIPWYFLTTRKWMKVGWFDSSIPLYYFTSQWVFLNESVKNFFVDHTEYYVLSSEYQALDSLLIYNHANQQFDPKIIWMFENLRPFREMFPRFAWYRVRPCTKEFLYSNLILYKEGLGLSILNPDSRYFTSGNVMTYSKKWIQYTYMVFNEKRFRPFVVYGFWTSDFFTSTFSLRCLSFRYEFFRDYMYIFRPIIGTTENFRWHLFFFFDIYLFSVFLFFFSIVFSIFYSKEKMIKLLILESHIGSFAWFIALFFNHLVYYPYVIRKFKLFILKSQKLKVNRKSQLESKFFNFIKNYIYIPIIIWYFDNIVKSRKYINWVEKDFLGSDKNYDLNNSYIYIFLIIVYIPLNFCYSFKTLFYKVHIMYYFKLNRIFRHFTFNSVRNIFSFNRFFSPRIVNKRELDKYTAWDVVERIINFMSIYSKKDFRNMINQRISEMYVFDSLARNAKRREEYWDLYYFRIFGNYDPELEFYDIQKSRFFTRFWYYFSDFSYHELSTHQLYTFFNFFSSPLHIRANYGNVYNFYYILFYIKFYFYYYYYIYFFFLNFLNMNYFYIYIYYFFYMIIYFFSCITSFFNFFFDGRNHLLLKYYWRDYFFVIFLWLRSNYFFINWIYLIMILISITVYYLLLLLFVNIRNFFLSLLNFLIDFFSVLINSDLNISYDVWHRYYMLKFYLIEYNIFYHIFIFLKNFFFNFFFILVLFFIISTIPFLNDILFSDFLVHNFYLFINKLFVLHKSVYFNEVLDNWWVPYFSPKKFVHYYLGYSNYFELRLRRSFGRFYSQAIAISNSSYAYNEFFFNFYFKKRFRYFLQYKYKTLHEFFMLFFPGFPPYDIYFIMHLKYFLTKHPARHFMLDVYYNVLPISWTFFWRYKYFLFVSKIFVPLLWFWKYSFSFIIFNSLYFVKDSPFFLIVLNFFKGWYNIYYYLNYISFKFFYYYFFYFFFTLSKLFRYNMVTYDIFYNFWIYRSVRFIIAVDFINFLRFLIDCVHFLFVELFFGFFIFLFKYVQEFMHFFGLTSFSSYLNFSLNFLPKFHFFFSEWFERFVSLNYDLDDYNRLLSSHYRSKTRARIGDFCKKDVAVRSIHKLLHKTISFEFKFRQFLFYTKKGLVKNFLIYNKMKVTSWNLLFFSFISVYFNYLFILIFLTAVSLKLRAFFKDDSMVTGSPFFEWERFNLSNRNLLGYNDFTWLYNIRWLRRFDFYIDKYFSDDLYLHTFRSNNIRFGYHLYNQWSKFFYENARDSMKGTDVNRFFLYKRFYLERYILMIKDIDLVFHEYSISNRKVQTRIFSYYDFFIPKVKDKLGFTFKKNIVRKLNQIDLFWFNFATPQLMSTRDSNFTYVMSRTEESKKFYSQLKKTLYKAYSFYEMNRITVPYDLFEFRFFESNFYDEFLYENISSKNASYKNYFLHNIALSRWNSELVYVTPSKHFSEITPHVGYRDWSDKLENHYYHLRYLNETYFGKFFDFGIFGFVPPLHAIITHADADTVKDTIDLAISDNIAGVKYSELYQYEDVGRVATEQYLFELLDSAFQKSRDNPNVNIVALTDDRTLTYNHNTTWAILALILPIMISICLLEDHIYSRKFVMPQQFFHDLMNFFLNSIFEEFDSEIILSHKLLSIEHIQQCYWFNPWTWIRTHIYDLYYIDKYSFWTGKHAKFLKVKEDNFWIFTIIRNDNFRYDNLSFLYWNFYVLAWQKCKESVIFFFLLDFFFYFLTIIMFLFVFNFSFYFFNIFSYFRSRPHSVLDSDFDVDVYQKMEDNSKKKQEQKKKNQFDFFGLESFTRLKEKADKYKQDPKRRRRF